MAASEKGILVKIAPPDQHRHYDHLPTISSPRNARHLTTPYKGRIQKELAHHEQSDMRIVNLRFDLSPEFIARHEALLVKPEADILTQGLLQEGNQIVGVFGVQPPTIFASITDKDVRELILNDSIFACVHHVRPFLLLQIPRLCPRIRLSK